MDYMMYTFDHAVQELRVQIGQYEQRHFVNGLALRQQDAIPSLATDETVANLVKERSIIHKTLEFLHRELTDLLASKDSGHDDVSAEGQTKHETLPSIVGEQTYHGSVDYQSDSDGPAANVLVSNEGYGPVSS